MLLPIIRTIVCACVLCAFSVPLFAQPIAPIEIILGKNWPIQPGQGPVSILYDKQVNDRVEQVEQGVRIEKLSGKSSSPCGLLIKQSATSLFTFMLDLEVIQLAAPRTPGIQGLLVQFVLDGPDQDITTIGLNSTSKGGRGFVFYTGPEPKYKDIPFQSQSFSAGTWLFKREGNELRFSIGEASDAGRFPTSFREIKRMPIGSGQLKEIHLLCRRQDTAKPSSEFLLKRIQFSGDAFYSQPAPKLPWWTKKRIYSMLYWICIATVIGYSIFRARDIKDWVLDKIGQNA